MQLLSHVQLFVTPWTTAHQALLSFTISQSLLQLMSIQSVMLPNNPILSLLLPQMVKRLPTMQETQVRSLGQEDPLEKEMATHSSSLAWKIPWTEESGRLQSMGSRRVGHD